MNNKVPNILTFDYIDFNYFILLDEFDFRKNRFQEAVSVDIFQFFYNDLQFTKKEIEDFKIDKVDWLIEINNWEIYIIKKEDRIKGLSDLYKIYKWYFDSWKEEYLYQELFNNHVKPFIKTSYFELFTDTKLKKYDLKKEIEIWNSLVLHYLSANITFYIRILEIFRSWLENNKLYFDLEEIKKILFMLSLIFETLANANYYDEQIFEHFKIYLYFLYHILWIEDDKVIADFIHNTLYLYHRLIFILIRITKWYTKIIKWSDNYRSILEVENLIPLPEIIFNVWILKDSFVLNNDFDIKEKAIFMNTKTKRWFVKKNDFSIFRGLDEWDVEILKWIANDLSYFYDNWFIKKTTENELFLTQIKQNFLYEIENIMNQNEDFNLKWYDIKSNTNNSNKKVEINTDFEKILEFENFKNNIKSVIIWQNNIIDDIVDNYLWKVFLGFNDRPVSFLFLWKSWTWKTELWKQIAQVLWTKYLHIPLGNFNEKHTLQTLLGSPPSYVWYDTPTILENYLLNDLKDWQIPIIIFDEIEKWHQELQNLFLELLDEGKITLSNGKILDLKKSIIILTSNLWVSKENKIWFDVSENENEKRKIFEEDMEKSVKDFLKIEVYNRISNTYFFNDLNNNIVNTILTNKISSIIERMKVNNNIMLLLKKCIIKEENEEKFNKEFEKLIKKLASIKNIEKSIKKEFDISNMENIRKIESQIENIIVKKIINYINENKCEK